MSKVTEHQCLVLPLYHGLLHPFPFIMHDSSQRSHVDLFPYAKVLSQPRRVCHRRSAASAEEEKKAAQDDKGSDDGMGFGLFDYCSFLT
jgi:hypothetical protein